MNSTLKEWVEECIELTSPASVHWCDGSEAENEMLLEQMVQSGMMQRLNQQEYPGCFLARSDPADVARVEGQTFICTTDRDDAGPNNNWMGVAEAKERVRPCFRGAMRGRTMYVVPYLMGPVGAKNSQVGVEITDSPYVVVNMRIMTRMGQVALDQLGEDGAFVPGLHSVGAPLAPGEKDVPWPCSDTKYILHFPEERLIWSYGSGYGGNALLGKKCFALRIASVQARDEGWMAEHMLLVELEDPAGEKTYFAGAFPSASGKTNFAMMVSPLEDQGYRVRTIGDDIAWMYPGDDGRLWAMNPEAGFFGVVPGTSMRTNPNALLAASRNSIYTNVAVSSEGIPWWEGKTSAPPEGLTDWKGRPWMAEEPAAHPNSRFTAPASQCPSISPQWEDPRGVPISGIIFGGRRSSQVPLVVQSNSWNQGVFLGATMASETTGAATGKVGVLRRDPMAMLPFCGYHMGDYFAHWIRMGKTLPSPPQIFHVNWFRRDNEGQYLWPGYGDNVRVLIWMRERIAGRADAKETPIGCVPTVDSLMTDGLDITPDRLRRVLNVDDTVWADEIPDIRAHLDQFGDRLPDELCAELDAVEARLGLGG